MTTLEYMKKQLDKYKRNHYNAALRNAPKSNISDLKVKISHYETVCKLLEGVFNNA